MTIWSCLPEWIFKAAIHKQEFISSTKIGHDQNIPAKPTCFLSSWFENPKPKNIPPENPFQMMLQSESFNIIQLFLYDS